jgi:hypothetical protein
MEHLWSSAVATGGKRWKLGRPPRRLRQAITVAVGCDQLRESLHRKEGVHPQAYCARSRMGSALVVELPR